MRIATWNVNSIKAHFEQVTSWVQANKPDVLCLQEIKCEDPNFPAAAFEELGYQSAVHGQKTYNGVAILSRLPFENVTKALPGDSTDEQARYVTADVFEDKRMVKVCCLYLPNGNPTPGPKYDYKLSWMKRLEAEFRPILHRLLWLSCSDLQQKASAVAVLHFVADRLVATAVNRSNDPEPSPEQRVRRILHRHFDNG